WPRYPAELVMAQLVAGTDDTYGVESLVRYTVDGQSRTRQLDPTAWGALSSAVKELSALQTRATHTVSLDPDAPDQDRIMVDADHWSFDWVIGYLVMAIAGAVLLLFSSFLWAALASETFFMRFLAGAFVVFGVVSFAESGLVLSPLFTQRH